MRDGMKPTGWRYQRFEDKFAKGIPDVGFVLQRGGSGWVELKHSNTPATNGRVQQLPHFTIEQRRFLDEWPATYLLWRIEKDWFLFDQCFDELGHVPYQALAELAKHHWKGNPNWDFLAKMMNVSVNIT